MRIILLFALIGLLVGCAGTMDALNPKQIHPNVGDSFDVVNKMSNDAGTGDLVDITTDALNAINSQYSDNRIQQSDYSPYKFYRTFKRNFIDHSILPPPTPISDIFVFKQGKLVLISGNGASLAKDMQSLIEDDKRRAYYGADFDLASKIHADFGAWASKGDVANLHALNVKGVSDLDAAEAELRNYRELYRSADAGDLFRYLVDRAVSGDKHITIAQAAQLRKKEEEKAAKEKEREEEKRRAERLTTLRKMKFTALFVCVENPECPQCGWSWAFSKNLIGASKQHLDYVFAKFLTEGESAKYCTQTIAPFRNSELLISEGFSFGTDNDGAEYFLVKGSNSTIGVVGHRR